MKLLCPRAALANQQCYTKNFGTYSKISAMRSLHQSILPSSILKFTHADNRLLKLLLLSLQRNALSLTLGVLSKQLSAHPRIICVKTPAESVCNVTAHGTKHAVLDALRSRVDEAHGRILVVAHDGGQTVEFSGVLVYTEGLGEPCGIVGLFCAFLGWRDLSFGRSGSGFNGVEVLIDALQVALGLEVAETGVAESGPVAVSDDCFLLLAGEQVAQLVALCMHQSSDERSELLFGAAIELCQVKILESVVDGLVDQQGDGVSSFIEQTVQSAIPVTERLEYDPVGDLGVNRTGYTTRIASRVLKTQCLKGEGLLRE